MQSAGENLQEQGVELSQLLGEETSESFTHGWRDEFNDALTRNDETLSVAGGVVQSASGVAGVAGGVTIAAGGVLGCGATAGLTCLAAPAGAGIAALGASEIDAGLDKLLGDYLYTEGQTVAESFSGATHQGDISPDVELIKDAGIVGLEILSAKVGGKFLDKVVDKFQGFVPDAAQLDNPLGNGELDFYTAPRGGGSVNVDLQTNKEVVNDYKVSANEKIYSALGIAEVRATRRPEFDVWQSKGVPDTVYTLNPHAYNSLFKSGRKDIMPDDVLDALSQAPTPGSQGSLKFVNPETGTKVFVNPDNKQVVGIQPSNFGD